ncbi:hypothetical protein IWQ62_005626 [Dispira parvispora]|uniref:RRM domain-containing protein n=1 Tax=Dispira parvispora TaxID=1520584 RepID=A0A9W8E4J0_9FUNG|nr:hypothetical protein IWQ62_005626 [Dispira parvispora]
METAKAARQEWFDQRTVYVETLRPPFTTVDKVRELFSQCGPVAYVSLQYDKSGRFLGFAFIQFEEIQGASQAIAMFNAAPPTTEVAEQTVPKPPNLNLRVMSKKKWLELRDEYRAYAKEQQTQLQNQLRQRTKPLTFLEGTIVRFHGVHPHSKKPTIKELFEQFGNVANVDYTHGQLSGYIRFACPTDAQRCVDYFTEHPTVHLGPLDTHGQPLSSQEPSTPAPIVIRTKVLRGKEELTYWTKVRTLWSQLESTHLSKTPKRLPNPSMAATHVRFGNADDAMDVDPSPGTSTG